MEWPFAPPLAGHALGRTHRIWGVHVLSGRGPISEMPVEGIGWHEKLKSVIWPYMTLTSTDDRVGVGHR